MRSLRQTIWSVANKLAADELRRGHSGLRKCPERNIRCTVEAGIPSTGMPGLSFCHFNQMVFLIYSLSQSRETNTIFIGSALL